MMRILRTLVAAPLLLVACKKNEPPPAPPAPTPPRAAAPVTPPPPPPTTATPPAPQPDAAPADPKQGNWWSLKAPGEKQEIMEGWLQQFHSGNATIKAGILKDMANMKLSPADKVMLDQVRARLKLPPIPLP